MKKLGMCMLILSLGIGTSIAQDSKNQGDKITAKEEKARKNEENKKSYLALINDRSYLLEATTLYGKYMNVVNVSSNTNFIKVDNEELVIQSAGGFYPGYNGLGGITIKGKIIDYKVNENKNGINVMINFSSPLVGYGSVSLDVSSGGYASGRISDNWGGRATFRGEVLSLANSSAFEGMSLF